MNIEERLREHLARASERLPEPTDRFDAVVARGRRRVLAQRITVAAAAVVLLVAVPLTLRGLDRTQVDLEPGQPGPDPTPAETDEPGALQLSDLGAPVLAWGPYEHDQLMRVDEHGAERLGFPVDVAFPDGRGGVVFQPASQSQVRWSQHGQPLVEADGELVLRGMLPGDRVLYSVRHGSGEATTEDFFTVTLSEDAEPEHLVAAAVLERSIVGPAVAADRRLVHASCHIHCSLWVGLADSDEDEPIYDGLTIEGLTATPDGRLLAFVEHDVTLQTDPELVLLDGASFEETARVQLPGEDEQRMGVPVLSLSPDGQRALVSLGASGEPGIPTTPYLVEGLLSSEPHVRPIDFSGAVRWAGQS